MLILSRFKISGHSMEPSIKNGQEVLISGFPFLFSEPKTEEIVAFKDLDKRIIKRIKKVKKGKFLVKGDNKSDSKEFGWIDKEKIIGKVIYIFK